MRLVINQALTCWLEVCLRFDAIALHANGGYLKQTVKTLGGCVLEHNRQMRRMVVSMKRLNNRCFRRFRICVRPGLRMAGMAKGLGVAAGSGALHAF